MIHITFLELSEPIEDPSTFDGDAQLDMSRVLFRHWNAALLGPEVCPA